MSFQQFQDVYRIILLGDSGVGKSCLVQNYVKGVSQLQNLKPTLGVQYKSKVIPLSKNRSVKAQIWDTAGQQNYRSITSSYFKKAEGALIVFDVTNRKTFQSVQYWIDSLRQGATSNVQIILVGNKIDKSQQRAVSYQQASDLASRIGIQYRETTIINIQMINAAFRQICQKVYDLKNGVSAGREQKTGANNGSVNLGNNNNNFTSRCCGQ